MTKKIHFGLSVPSGSRDKSRRDEYLSTLHKALDMVSGHYESAWFVDHLQIDDVDILEGWTAITYLAALHPQFQFGNAVACQSYRNPALLAKMGATLQFLTGGRFILGIGAGWKDDEYEAYGYPFPSPGTRVEELDETLHIIRAMWQDERATFEGKHYSVRNAWCEPKPDPLPTIVVGGSKPKMLRVVARHADWWNVSWTGIDDYRQQVEECERACAELGRDPSTLRRTWFGGCACGPTEEAARELAGDRISTRNAFMGTPGQIIEQMQPFIELGVDYFMLSCGGFPKTTTIELLMNEVLPALNG